MMSHENERKPKNRRQSQSGLKRSLEKILGRLRDGLDDFVDGLRPARPQPVPIPVPVRRPRRR